MSVSITYTYNDVTYRTENAVRQAIWKTEHKAFGAVDSADPASFWSALGVTYTETEQTESFAVLKVKKLNALANSYNEAVSGSFTTSQGYNMQFDTGDCIKMEGAVKLLQTQVDAAEANGEDIPTGYLTQADDTTVYGIDVDTMTAVELEMLAQYAKCHLLKQQYRAAIDAAETADDLDAIEFTWEE